MPKPINLKVSTVTHPFRDIAQVVVSLGISPSMPLPTAVEMFTELDEVARAGSLKWAEGVITLNLTNPSTAVVSPELNEKISEVCMELLQAEFGYRTKQ